MIDIDTLLTQGLELSPSETLYRLLALSNL